MIERWNPVVVEPGAEVWHLGDFPVRQSADRVGPLLKVLNGRKRLLVGNNDDAAVTGCDGWESVQAFAELVVDNVRLVMCRYPSARSGT